VLRLAVRGEALREVKGQQRPALGIGGGPAGEGVTQHVLGPAGIAQQQHGRAGDPGEPWPVEELRGSRWLIGRVHASAGAVQAGHSRAGGARFAGPGRQRRGGTRGQGGQPRPPPGRGASRNGFRAAKHRGGAGVLAAEVQAEAAGRENPRHQVTVPDLGSSDPTSVEVPARPVMPAHVIGELAGHAAQDASEPDTPDPDPGWLGMGKSILGPRQHDLNPWRQFPRRRERIGRREVGGGTFHETEGGHAHRSPRQGVCQLPGLGPFQSLHFAIRRREIRERCQFPARL